MNQFVVVIAVLGVFALLAAIWYFLQSSAERRRQELRRRLTNVVDDVDNSLGPQILRRGKFSENEALDSTLRNLDLANKAEELLDQTELEMTVAQLFGTCAGVGAGLFLLLAVYIGNFSLAMVGGLVGLFLPYMYVVNLRDKRSEQFSAALPEALEMLSRSLKAGHALPTSFQLVAKELPPPIATEFAKAYEEQKLGKSLDEAVHNMTYRVHNNLDLKIFAVLIAIQKETGGNMIELLDGLATTIRDRYSFYGKIRVLTSEGKSAATILCSLPFVVLTFLILLNPDYLVPLVETTIGKVFIVLGLISMSLGVFVMSRMIKIEV